MAITDCVDVAAALIMRIRLVQKRKSILYTAATSQRRVFIQHFVHFLVSHKGYPAALMANEVELTVGGKRLRCDSVLFDKERRPRMIIEYKAESISLTDKVLTQVATYNMLLHVDYLMVSNGNTHLCLHYNHGKRKWEFLPGIPQYSEL